MANIRSYKELRVYQAAIDAAMRIFEITKRFPPEEKFSMVDQTQAHLDRFVQTSAKLGGSDDIQQISEAS